MDLSTFMHALVATWLLLSGPSDTQAYLPSEQLPTIEQPRSARFRFEGRFESGQDRASLSGQGAFVQPDRAQFSLDGNASGRDEHYEAVVIGQTVYTREGANGRWERRDAGNNPSFPFPGGPGAASGTDPRLNEILQGFQPLGPESVDGQLTDRYHGELDFLTMLRGATAADPSIRIPFRGFGMSVDLWIGRADRYVHRVRIGIDAQLQDARPGQPDRVSGELRMTLSSLDQPIAIVAPSGQTPLAPPVQAPAQLPSRGGR